MRTTFTNHLTPEEYHLALRVLTKHAAGRLPFKHGLTLLRVAFWMAAGVAIMHLASAAGLPREFRLAMVGLFFAALVGAQALSFVGMRKLARASVGKQHESQSTLEVSEGGVDLHGSQGGSFTRWSGFEGVEEVNGVVLLRLDALRSILVSGTAFADAAERAEFIAYARERIAARPPVPEEVMTRAANDELLVSPVALATAAAPTPRLSERLRDALRLAFLRPVAIERLQPGWGEIFAAIVLTLAIPSLFGLVDQGAGGVFDPQYIPQAVILFAMAAITAIAIGVTTRRREVVPAVLFAILLAWIAIDVLVSIAYTVVMEANENVPRFLHQVFVIAPYGWLALATARFAVPLHESPTARKALTALCAFVLLALPMGYVAPDRSLWVKDWSRDARAQEAQAAARTAASEAAWYAQPELLARELDAVQPGREGTVDLYFVGLAGYASQDVFMREVASVAQLMRERFDAEGRIVRLVNNRKTLLDTPIASLTSLKRALKRVAERMNGDEDVAVIFLTSHGSEDHRFSLELWPIRFDTLDPKALKQALDESGIRKRVVIVSACYSGGFTRALADPNTLVITASAPDRNSFGCSNEAEWTYFGRAYFDEALRRTRSFTQAFEMATPVIAEREAAQQFPPSNPVMRGGEALEGTLRQLEARLETATATASAEAPKTSH